MSRTLIIEEDDVFEQQGSINLKQFLDPYKKSKYLPDNIFNKLINIAFPENKIMIQHTNTHKTLIVKVSSLLALPIRNWKFNRPADVIRVLEIADNIYKKKKTSNVYLYLSFNNTTQTFEIFDGIHRFMALKKIKEKNSEPSDLLGDLINDNAFGYDNNATWLYESYITIDLRINASEGEIVDEFRELNMSVPVAELYIRDESNDKKNIIENLVNKWFTTYYGHFVASNRSNRYYKPNTSQQAFTELLDVLYDKYKITEENKQLLEDKLNIANDTISYNLPRGLSAKTIQKCTNSKCWLFVYSLDELKNNNLI